MKNKEEEHRRDLEKTKKDTQTQTARCKGGETRNQSVRKYQQNYPNEQMKSNIFFNNLKVKSFFIFNKIMIYYFLKKIYCLFL